MGSRKIVLVLTVGFSFLITGIFWREANTKRLFSQCRQPEFTVFIYLFIGAIGWGGGMHIAQRPVSRIMSSKRRMCAAHRTTRAAKTHL
jgi:hypothetical protein